MKQVLRILAISASVDSSSRTAKNKRMALVGHWFDFICFSIVGVAFFGALLLICWRETAKIEPPRRTCTTTCLYECLTVITRAEESSNTTKTAHSLLWKSCWPGLAPAWLLAFRFFSFALLCVVSALDFPDYGASIFVYYTGWTFALVIVYFAMTSL